MRHLITSLTLILALVSASCQYKEKPKPESKDHDGGVARVMQGVKWDVAGPELKTSLQEYVKETYPGWEIRGEMIQFGKFDFYLIVVDIVTEKERKSVTVVSRMFRRADDTYYWKCEPFTPEIKSLQELVDSKSADRPLGQSN